jgi:hypothetical protein
VSIPQALWEDLNNSVMLKMVTGQFLPQLDPSHWLVAGMMKGVGEERDHIVLNERQRPT